MLSGYFLLDFVLMLGNVVLQRLEGLRAQVMLNFARVLGGNVRGDAQPGQPLAEELVPLIDGLRNVQTGGGEDQKLFSSMTT